MNMKFGFEKHVNTPEVKPAEIEQQLTEEERQQKFEEECIIEAGKLKVSLEELKKDIDALGGEEKFKEYFEQPVNKEDGFSNRAGQTKVDSDRNIEKLKGTFGRNAGLVMMGIGALGTYLVSKDNPEWASNSIAYLQGQFPKDMDFNEILNWQERSTLVMSAVTTMIGTLGPITHLRSILEARKLKREQKINDLKFKMTGVEAKHINNK